MVPLSGTRERKRGMRDVRPAKVGSTGGTESADRVADVLLLIAESDRPVGVSTIARSLSLSKAVVHRILQSLTSRSLLQLVQSDSTYTLGPAATLLGTKAWSHMDLRTLASPILRLLRDETQETTTLSVLIRDQRIYLDQFESPQEVKMVVELGRRFALHSGASSRAILAFMPPRYIDDAVLQLEAARPGFDAGAYVDTLDEVRQKGFAVSLNERNTGAAAIAAPLFDPSGSVIGSISSSGPVTRYGLKDHEDHARLVVEAARVITAGLSGKA
jgi:DNA-binding IclR family transcriptional regulator